MPLQTYRRKANAEIYSFFALLFLPTLISTFCIFPNRKPTQKKQKELIFPMPKTQQMKFILNKTTNTQNKMTVSRSKLAVSCTLIFLIHIKFIFL